MANNLTLAAKSKEQVPKMPPIIKKNKNKINLADQKICEYDDKLLDDLNHWLFRCDKLTNSLKGLDISGPDTNISY